MQKDILSTGPESEIVASRAIEYSRDVIFTAWTDPKHLASWWGPAGFTNTFHEFDLRVGGRWRFTMHGPEKGNYENECEFIKIQPPSLIAWQRISKPIFQVLATFDELGPAETMVTFKMLFESVEECDKLRKFVPGKNEENLDRLEVECAKIAASQQEGR